MYSFNFSSFNMSGNKKHATLSVFFDGELVETRIVSFDKDATQESMDDYANSVIDYIEEID